MEEKILIKSEMNQKLKKIMLTLMGVLLGVSVIIFIALSFKSTYTEYSYYYSKQQTYWISGYQAAFDGFSPDKLVLFILACVWFVAGTIISIIYWALSKCSLVITDHNVKGKTLFGKEIVLPLYMISAYTTRKLFSTIAIATSSGVTKFSLIKNYAEIGEVLSQKINERQTSTASTTNTTSASNSSHAPETPAGNSMDDLFKLKSLLDAGIITQEEFEAKKKNLLGL